MRLKHGSEMYVALEASTPRYELTAIIGDRDFVGHLAALEVDHELETVRRQVIEDQQCVLCAET
jgi:hypothetical protein